VGSAVRGIGCKRKSAVSGIGSAVSGIGCKWDRIGCKRDRLGCSYGLTEVYGPVVICAWHDEWNSASPADRAKLKSRQGVK
jgi:hypothetical protein